VGSIAENLENVRARIAAAARRAGRDPGRVRLAAVTKSRPIEAARAAIAAGALDLAENRVQEAQAKFPALAAESPGGAARPRFHLIGHLQTNKAKLAAQLFDWIHSVDSARVGEALDRACKALNRESINILIQVNISGEDTKSGVAPGEAQALLETLARLPRLRVRGLMTMAPFEEDPERARPVFRGLRELRDRLARSHIPGADLEELSMGMTGDFEVAVEEGATFVRIGTAIFQTD